MACNIINVYYYASVDLCYVVCVIISGYESITNQTHTSI